ncbi:hypothetical protein SDC9_114912 [bioreactor metagenome]|uniref:Uncharacterized protein n=1 Tax=bioreactor metagenome TaxID=1076179 RepID=A0A645BRJ6_9ZZZZ
MVIAVEFEPGFGAFAHIDPAIPVQALADRREKGVESLRRNPETVVLVLFKIGPAFETESPRHPGCGAEPGQPGVVDFATAGVNNFAVDLADADGMVGRIAVAGGIGHAPVAVDGAGPEHGGDGEVPVIGFGAQQPARRAGDFAVFGDGEFRRVQTLNQHGHLSLNR